MEERLDAVASGLAQLRAEVLVAMQQSAAYRARSIEVSAPVLSPVSMMKRLDSGSASDLSSATVAYHPKLDRLIRCRSDEAGPAIDAIDAATGNLLCTSR